MGVGDRCATVPARLLKCLPAPPTPPRVQRVGRKQLNLDLQKEMLRKIW